MTDSKKSPTCQPPFGSESHGDDLLSSITSDSWESHRQYQRYRANIENGNPEYNTGGYQNDRRVSPSQSVQCFRKHYYRQFNAPEETSPPHGIFWAGSEIEEELVVPWLRSIAEEHGCFVQNDLYLEITVSTDVGELVFAGLTDPALCQRDGTPTCITEVKTKQSLSKLTEPAERHAIQATVYQRAAADKFGIDPPPVKLIYIGRKRHDACVFNLDYDVQRWNRVLDWAKGYVQEREDAGLPEADPVESWECQLCSFRARCGQDDGQFSDQRATGLLPFKKYPSDSLVNYLNAHDGAKLTPTCARQHPELAKRYEVLPLTCPRCTEQFEWTEVSWESTDSEGPSPPACPSCIENNELVEIWPPDPADQL